MAFGHGGALSVNFPVIQLNLDLSLAAEIAHGPEPRILHELDSLHHGGNILIQKSRILILLETGSAIDQSHSGREG